MYEPITTKVEKVKWRELECLLRQVRNERTIDVVKVVIDSKLIPISLVVEDYYQLYNSAPETIYSKDATIQKFLELEYGQFLAAINFFYPEAEFSTEHGVKGEEYDNVIFVIGKGWTQYQFEKYAPMINGIADIPKGKEESFVRNRNLFYMCCSRPKKRLILFVMVPVDSTFKIFLSDLVGVDNIFSYDKFIDKCNDEQ